MPKKGSTAVKVTFMTMTLVTPVTAVKFDYGAVLYSDKDLWFLTLYRMYVCVVSIRPQTITKCSGVLSAAGRDTTT